MVAHAVKRVDCEEKEDDDAAAALPHAVAPVGAPSLHCCGGERSAYFCGGAEETKRGDWVEEKDGDAFDAAAALSHAVAPVGAPCVYSCGGAEAGFNNCFAACACGTKPRRRPAAALLGRCVVEQSKYSSGLLKK
jgi:hypothetical protein